MNLSPLLFPNPSTQSDSYGVPRTLPILLQLLISSLSMKEFLSHAQIDHDKWDHVFLHLTYSKRLKEKWTKHRQGDTQGPS